MASPINVGVALPGDNMDPDAIDTAASNLSTTGTNVSGTGDTVYTDWQGLSGVYHAPEQELLFNSMTPAKTAAELFGTDMGTASSALITFAGEVRTIKAAVAKIKADALAFLGTIHNGEISKPITGPQTRFATSTTQNVDWDSDQDAVNTNNALIHRMNDQQEALWRAERTCANALNAICGAAQISAADPNNPKGGGYGYNDLPDNAQMPWGHSVQRKEDCAERAVKGFFVDGLWNGFVQGITSLVGFSWSGPDGIGFHWSTLGHAWEGVAKLATALNPANGLVAMIPGPIGSWSRDSQKTLVQTVTGMVGIDPYAKDPFAAWKNDPARTGGSTVFNVLSFLVPESKVGAVGKAGDVGRVGDATELAGDAGRAGRVISLVGDGAKWLKGVTLDGLTKIGGKFDLDLGKVFKFGDDTKIPQVGRDGVDTGHTNLGGHDHSDAPPARTPDHQGTGTGGHEGAGTHDGSGTHDGAGTHDGSGSHDGAGSHDGSGTHDGAGTHTGGTDPGHAVTGETTPHTITHNPADYVRDVNARAEKATEHTTALRERNALAHELGVDPKNLTVAKSPGVLRQLEQHATTPADFDRIDSLRNAVQHERVTARELNRASENLGTTAAHDVLLSRGEDIITGGDTSVAGKPGTLDTIGLSHDHSTLTVIEAKGGDGSRLGVRSVDGVQVQQGSTAYLNDLLHRDPEFRQYLSEHPDLARSIADGTTKIEYDMVKARNSGLVEVTPFTLDPGQLHLGDLVNEATVGGRK